MKIKISDAIEKAKTKILSEFSIPSRIDISTDGARQLMTEYGFPPNKGWKPKDGESIGIIFDIPVFIDNSVELFVVSAKEKK